MVWQGMAWPVELSNGPAGHGLVWFYISRSRKAARGFELW